MSEQLVCLTCYRQRNASSTSSSDSGESEMVAANLTLPSTGTQPSQRGNKRTEVYYFYQSADGQHVYMHSINTRYYHKPIHLLIWGSYFDALATYTFVCGCCFNPVFFLFIVFLRFMKCLCKFLYAHL